MRHLSLDSSWIEVNGGRIRHNLKAFRKLLHKTTNLMVVVKGNAYGHGLKITCSAAMDWANWFGVDSLTEALGVEQIVPKKPILILGHSNPSDANTIVEHGFRQTIYREDLAQALSQAAQNAGKSIKVHLKAETGTNRQGVASENIVAFAKKVAALPHIEIEGLYTHFANIEDTLDPSYAQIQLQRFKDVIQSLSDANIRPNQIHAAATSGLLLYPETHLTMVRLGIGAYGIWPSRETRIAARQRGRELDLLPALSWKSSIAQLKKIKENEFVGYGLAFQANRPITLSVIPVGYYEGYDRGLSNSGRALIAGKAATVIGRVAMNMMMLDVTDIEPSIDDEVVLIGKQGDSEITAEELAEKIGTIPYEILSRINPLLERRIHGKDF